MNQKAKDWARNHKFSLQEPIRKIKGKKGYGHPVHPYRSPENVKMIKGLDEQWKRNSKTSVRRKSLRSTTSLKARRIDGSICNLISKAELVIVERDPIEVAIREKEYKKMKRQQNRNPRARRGNKRVV